MYNSDPCPQDSDREKSPLLVVRSSQSGASTSASPTSDWSLTLQTLLDQPASTLPARLAWAGVLFSCCCAGWAWFGQVNEVAQAQGKLIPQGEVYKIHPTELGKISQVLVKEGQVVKAGQLIAALDPALANHDVERLRQDLLGDQTQLAQLQMLLVQTQAQADTRKAIGSAATQAQVGAVSQAQVGIGTTEALLTQLELDKKAQLERLQRLQPLAEAGAIAQEQVFRVEQELRDRDRTITEHQGNLERTQAEVKRLQSEVAQKQAEEQESAAAAAQQAQQITLRITELQTKIRNTQVLIASAQVKLQQFFLYAPVDGVVSTLNLRNIGEVVQPGQAIAEITPQHRSLVLVAALPNHEAGFVKPGMPVQVKLDAYPFQDYGVVSAKVMTISPDTKPDQQWGPVYRVEVQLDRDHITKDHQPIPFKAGQTATAEIVTRQRRIAEVIFDPLKKMQGDINL
jgi:hemolysin D